MEDIYRANFVVDDQACNLDVHDTGGDDELAMVRDQAIQACNGVILVYSVTSRPSFDQIPEIHRSITQKWPSERASLPLPVVLVGNKIDDYAKRVVSPAEGESLAEKLGCTWAETSAKTGVGVRKAFFDAVRLLRGQLSPSITLNHEHQCHKRSCLDAVSLFKRLQEIIMCFRSYTSVK
jgi:GTPase SAR1 family protein